MVAPIPNEIASNKEQTIRIEHLPGIENDFRSITQVFYARNDADSRHSLIQKIVKGILTQDRHAIGEMLLEWVGKTKEEVIKKKEQIKNDPLHPVRSHYLGQQAILTDLETFIKSELMNKDV